MKVVWIGILSLSLPLAANAQMLGTPLISTSAAGVVSAASVYTGGISTSQVVYRDGSTQTKAFQGVMTVRVNNVSNFVLPSGGSAAYTANCNAGEIATGGGCSDSGFKMFYMWIPTQTSYSCSWFNTSGASVTISAGAVYVNCLK